MRIPQPETKWRDIKIEGYGNIDRGISGTDPLPRQQELIEIAQKFGFPIAVRGDMPREDGHEVLRYVNNESILRSTLREIIADIITASDVIMEHIFICKYPKEYHEIPDGLDAGMYEMCCFINNGEKLCKTWQWHDNYGRHIHVSCRKLIEKQQELDSHITKICQHFKKKLVSKLCNRYR